MKIIEDKDLPAENGCIIIIGNFDGVHVGHRQLLRKAREMGESLGLPVLAWTFREHPASFFGGHKYISTLEDRLSCFAEEGVSYAYLADFERFRNVDGDEFASEWLVKVFGARCVVCGFNFTYGKGKSGNAERLKEKLSENGAEVCVVPPVYVDGEVVSSSVIRKCITEGDVRKAAKLLGRPYSFDLTVVHGNAYGRKIGFPTANVVFPKGLVIPRFGVYATLCRIDEKVCKGVSNIGIRPTVEEEKKDVLCETHILGESFDMYGKEIKVDLISLIREERKFGSFAELTEQVKKDIMTAEDIFRAEEVL